MDGEAHFSAENTISFERQLPCTVTEAWQAVTDPESLGVWFIETRMDFRDGGRFEFIGAWRGRVADIVPERSVGYVADEGGVTRFEVFARAGGSGVRMTDRVGPAELPPEDHAPPGSFQPGGPGTHWAGVIAGWHGFMDALVRYLGGDAPTHAMNALIALYAARLEARGAG